MNNLITVILVILEVSALSFLSVQIMIQVHKRWPGFLPSGIEEEIVRYMNRKGKKK